MKPKKLWRFRFWLIKIHAFEIGCSYKCRYWMGAPLKIFQINFGRWDLWVDYCKIKR